MVTNQEIIHFAHVPKCGGQSFKKGLHDAYGDEVYFFYLIPMPIFFWRKVHLFLWRIRNRFVAHKVPSGTKIIYGHFCFDDLPVPESTEIRRGAFFRDPVEWLGSYYFYARAKYPEQFHAGPLDAIRAIGLSAGFRKYLGSINVRDLDFVGLQEEYSTSLALYEKIFGRRIPQVFKNETSSKPQGSGPNGTYREYFKKEGLLDQIEEAMKDNMEIYKSAVTQYNLLARRHNLPIHE